MPAKTIEVRRLCDGHFLPIDLDRCEGPFKLKYFADESKLRTLLVGKLLDQFGEPIRRRNQIHLADRDTLGELWCHQGLYFVRFKQYPPIDPEDSLAAKTFHERPWQYQEVEVDFVAAWSEENRVVLPLAPRSETAPANPVSRLRELHPRARTQIALLEFMSDRKTATFQETGREVHDDANTSDETVRQNVCRVNESLEEMKHPLRFRVGSGCVIKDDQPE
jgi:hypothetical protein